MQEEISILTGMETVQNGYNNNNNNLFTLLVHEKIFFVVLRREKSDGTRKKFLQTTI